MNCIRNRITAGAATALPDGRMSGCRHGVHPRRPARTDTGALPQKGPRWARSNAHEALTGSAARRGPNGVASWAAVNSAPKWRRCPMRSARKCMPRRSSVAGVLVAFTSMQAMRPSGARERRRPRLRRPRPGAGIRAVSAGALRAAGHPRRGAPDAGAVPGTAWLDRSCPAGGTWVGAVPARRRNAASASASAGNSSATITARSNNRSLTGGRMRGRLLVAFGALVLAGGCAKSHNYSLYSPAVRADLAAPRLGAENLAGQLAGSPPSGN
jgi:hypothetical protein